MREREHSFRPLTELVCASAFYDRDWEKINGDKKLTKKLCSSILRREEKAMSSWKDQKKPFAFKLIISSLFSALVTSRRVPLQDLSLTCPLLAARAPLPPFPPRRSPPPLSSHNPRSCPLVTVVTHPPPLTQDPPPPHPHLDPLTLGVILLLAQPAILCRLRQSLRLLRQPQRP